MTESPPPPVDPELHPTGQWSRVGSEAKGCLYTVLSLLIVVANPFAVIAMMVLLGNPYAAFLPPVASSLVAIWISREAVWQSNRNLTQFFAETAAFLAGCEIIATLILGAMAVLEK
jgi:hypothetical protein